jgi:Core-2/I-Branching enzyme
MLKAERILLKNALLDPNNDRFVFLSDRLVISSFLQSPTDTVKHFMVIMLIFLLFPLSCFPFSIISDSCIPLYNFSYTYDYIMSSTRSFIDRYHFAIELFVTLSYLLMVYFFNPHPEEMWN